MRRVNQKKDICWFLGFGFGVSGWMMVRDVQICGVGGDDDGFGCGILCELAK